MGRLTTHVLDTAGGVPAAGVAVSLYRRSGAAQELLRTTTTNADGRCDSPLLEGDALRSGRYRLVFAMGRYFAAGDSALPDPSFLDDVVIDFGIADPAAHYHIPLLVSPWSYATYRGS